MRNRVEFTKKQLFQRVNVTIRYIVLFQSVRAVISGVRPAQQRGTEDGAGEAWAKSIAIVRRAHRHDCIGEGSPTILKSCNLQ